MNHELYAMHRKFHSSLNRCASSVREVFKKYNYLTHVQGWIDKAIRYMRVRLVVENLYFQITFSMSICLDESATMSNLDILKFP